MKDRFVNKMISINISLLDEVEVYIIKYGWTFSQFVRESIEFMLSAKTIPVTDDKKIQAIKEILKIPRKST